MAQTAKQQSEKKQLKDTIRELSIRIIIADDLLTHISDEKAMLELLRRRNALLCRIEAVKQQLERLSKQYSTESSMYEQDITIIK